MVSSEEGFIYDLCLYICVAGLQLHGYNGTPYDRSLVRWMESVCNRGRKGRYGMKLCEEMQLALGKLMARVIELDGQQGIDAYICYQGRTGCLCITVYEDGILAYSRKSFMGYGLLVFDLIADVDKMLEAVGCSTIQTA